MNQWEQAQQHEKSWWGTCQNTFGEEVKQTLYANKMGLTVYDNGDSPFNIRAEGKVLDIGGGPVSMLLKCDTYHKVQGTVVDPCNYPSWVSERYIDAEIEYVKMPAEEFNPVVARFDEVWIYNCLQHTKDPEKIIDNAKAIGNKIRIFEWIDHETNAMHPHKLTEKDLNKWLEGTGTTEELNELGCVGKAYYGVFHSMEYMVRESLT